MAEGDPADPEGRETVTARTRGTWAIVALFALTGVAGVVEAVFDGDPHDLPAGLGVLGLAWIAWRLPLRLDEDVLASWRAPPVERFRPSDMLLIGLTMGLLWGALIAQLVQWARG